MSSLLKSNFCCNHGFLISNGHRNRNYQKIDSYFCFTLQDELEPHERCIRKILEQKGRVIEIVYRLENCDDDIIEGFEAIDAFEENGGIDEIGVDVAFDDEGLFGDDARESAFRKTIRNAWVRIQLGK